MSATPTPPRYRLVLDLTFPGLSPFEDDTCLRRLARAMEQIADPSVSDVRVREALTISAEKDDFWDWKQSSGAYDPAKRPAGTVGNIRGLPPRHKE